MHPVPSLAKTNTPPLLTARQYAHSQIQHTSSYTLQLISTVHPVPSPAKTNTPIFFTVCQYAHSQIQQEFFPKTDCRIHILTHSTIARSTNCHSDPCTPTPIADSHTTHHPGTSQATPPNRQSTLQKPTTLPTKENRRPQIQHRPNAAPPDISQHSTNVDPRTIPHQLLQLPLIHPPILTHPLILSSHSIHTAMAPISDSHPATQHTRNFTGQMQDSRIKARGTTGSNGAGIPHRSNSKTSHQHTCRGGGEEAAISLTGVRTRSRNTRRR